MIGNGLFASRKIKKGTTIAEYEGKLIKSYLEDAHEQSKSNILFDDGTALICYQNNMASYANDPINFDFNTRRKLMKNLMSDKPFYTVHNKAVSNGYIKLNIARHRAFIIAMCDINKDEEIFCHYGFNYWFTLEGIKKGFLDEKIMEEGNFSANLLDYSGYISYLKLFYPDYTKVEVVESNKEKYILVHFNDDVNIQFPYIDIKKMFTRIPIDNFHNPPK